MVKKIVLQKDSKNKKIWSTFGEKDDGQMEHLIDIDLVPSSISNKFGIVKNTLIDLSNDITSFAEWFSDIIIRYKESNYNSQILLDEADSFREVAEEYVDLKGVDFDIFANKDKSSKTSIMFFGSDIKAMAIASTCLKMYSFFACDSTMKLPDNAHRKMYTKMVSSCIESDTTTKIFQLVRSRIYKCSITDRYMWDLVKMMVSETPDSHVMSVFNFIMINLLSTLEIDKNPVPFMVSIIDDSVRWMMKTVYKERIIYGEAFGGTDDIYGSALTKESFHLYCCNDVIGKSAKAALTIVENEYSLTEKQFEELRDRIDGVEILTPPIKLLTLPIASRVLEIPYKFLLTCSPKHAILIGLFMSHISQEILNDDYGIIMKFLASCPTTKNSLSTRSSYKIRNLEPITNNPSSVFGFQSKILKFEVLSSICGVLSAAKGSLVNTLTGSAIGKLQNYNMEYDVIKFFTEMYSGQLDKKFEQIRAAADNYF